MFKRLLAVPAILLVLSCQTTQAEENLWIYAKGTDTRPAGSAELKLNTVSRLGKDSGDYTFHDIRPELEFGLTDRLTIGAELLFFDHDYSVDDPDLQPMFDTQGGAGGRFNDTQFAGVEASLKYNILSPYKDIIGFSIGLGYEHRIKYRLDGADIDQDSWTTTLFFQKNFLDDTLVFVFNPKVEFERRKSPGVLEEEIALDIAAGVAYRFAPKWFAGFEFRHQSDYLNPEEDGQFDPDLQRSSFDIFSDVRVGTQHQNGNYVGPSIHYAEQHWWVTGGVLYQIFGGGSVNAFNRDGKNFDEHEKYHVGFSIGYEF